MKAGIPRSTLKLLNLLTAVERLMTPGTVFHCDIPDSIFAEARSLLLQFQQLFPFEKEDGDPMPSLPDQDRDKVAWYIEHIENVQNGKLGITIDPNSSGSPRRVKVVVPQVRKVLLKLICKWIVERLEAIVIRGEGIVNMGTLNDPVPSIITGTYRGEHFARYLNYFRWLEQHLPVHVCCGDSVLGRWKTALKDIMVIKICEEDSGNDTTES